MEFRPCIDIHNGKVKQIVGSSLKDQGNIAEENFVSEQDSIFFANLYRKAGICGGHIVMLNAVDSEYYEATRNQAIAALRTYPEGFQIGGGITPDNASYFIKEGASHVIVTSYVFKDGIVNYENLEQISGTVGKKHLVLDLSCRYREDGYYIVTDRWQKFTDEKVTLELLDDLSKYCDEFLIHAVDVEGKARGIEQNLVKLLGKWGKIPVTYAGGIRNFDDLQMIYDFGNNNLNVTVGSALDLFGGNMQYIRVLEFCNGTGDKYKE